MKAQNQKIYEPKRTYDIYNPADRQIILNYEKDYFSWANTSKNKDHLIWFARLGLIRYYKNQVFHYRSQIEKFEDMSAKWSALQLLRIARAKAKEMNQPVLLNK